MTDPKTVLELLDVITRRIQYPNKWVRDDIPTGAAIRAKGGLTFVHLDDPEANCFTLLGSLLLSLKQAQDYIKAKRLHDALTNMIHEEVCQISNIKPGVRAKDIMYFNMHNSHKGVMNMLKSVEEKLRSPVRTVKDVLHELLKLLVNENSWSNHGIFFDAYSFPCAQDKAAKYSLMGALLKITPSQRLIALTVQCLDHALCCLEIESTLSDYAASCSHTEILVLIMQALHFLTLKDDTVLDESSNLSRRA